MPQPLAWGCLLTEATLDIHLTQKSFSLAFVGRPLSSVIYQAGKQTK